MGPGSAPRVAQAAVAPASPAVADLPCDLSVNQRVGVVDAAGLKFPATVVGYTAASVYSVAIRNRTYTVLPSSIEAPIGPMSHYWIQLRTM